MLKYVWYVITNFGDTSILLPCALLVALVLFLKTSTRHLSVVWIFLVVIVDTVVAITKVLYMGWRLGIPSLDFTGLSGHTTVSFLVWPVTFLLFLGQTEVRRIIGIGFGVLLGVLVAVSRLEVHAHSIAEVVFGGIFGLTLSSVFIFRKRNLLQVAALRRGLALALILPLAIGLGHTVPAESILATVARMLSGHSYVYTRADLHSASSRSPASYTDPPQASPDAQTR